MEGPQLTTDAPGLRAVFAGRRGRLLMALMLAEFGAAVQGIAYSTVLPLAASDLDGSKLYGATLAAATLASVFMLALGPGVLLRLGLNRALGIATVMFAAGAALSALAPAMVWILVGSVIRGLSAGVVAGFGYSALASLYEDALRPRVFGLFAFMWLVPSIVGPPVNAAIAGSVGWRWAMVWPAVLVIAARIAIALNSAVIPQQAGQRRVSPWIGLGVVASIGVASWASSAHGVAALVAYVVAFAAAVALSIVLLARAAEDRRRLVTLGAFFGLCVVYTSADAVFSLAIIDALHSTVLIGGATVGVAATAWSLLGLLPARRAQGHFGRAPIGAALTLVGVVAFGAVLVWGAGAVAVGVAVGAAALIGVGMGLAYPVQSSANFDELDPAHVTPVATAAAFAETASVAVGGLLTGGIYSLGVSDGAAPAALLALGFGVTAVLAAVTVGLAVAASRPAKRLREAV
ncbi:MFS transporter [Gryllotalpicola ginsengisoli]|uniref:MFS transporter n=1 Tax=Gryllotalpicola ginsengisoli TaxID=444608 RepID=UPI0003B4FE57|nr:MFS transporter [Gryllotalpicola ginsengisoli]